MAWRGSRAPQELFSETEHDAVPAASPSDARAPGPAPALRPRGSGAREGAREFPQAGFGPGHTPGSMLQRNGRERVQNASLHFYPQTSFPVSLS